MCVCDTSPNPSKGGEFKEDGAKKAVISSVVETSVENGNRFLHFGRNDEKSEKAVIAWSVATKQSRKQKMSRLLHFVRNDENKVRVGFANPITNYQFKKEKQ